MTHHDQCAVRGLIGELLDPSVEVKHADAMRHDRKRPLTVRCVVHTLLPTALPAHGVSECQQSFRRRRVGRSTAVPSHRPGWCLSRCFDLRGGCDRDGGGDGGRRCRRLERGSGRAGGNHERESEEGGQVGRGSDVMGVGGWACTRC